MAFSDDVIKQAWTRSGEHCEWTRISHVHFRKMCLKYLIYENRGSEGRGAWEAYHIDSPADDSLSNCELLCWE